MDKDYVARCRDGSPDDFRHLVERYERPLAVFLAGKLGNRGQVEEAAQESFVRAFFGLPKLKQPDSFYGWLLGIASRVAKECLRKRRFEPLPEDAPAAETPEKREAGDLDEAIAGLPEAYRRVILLRFFEELSCQEIAERLEMPLGTVTKTLSRAYALLRQTLQAEGKPEAPVCTKG